MSSISSTFASTTAGVSRSGRGYWQVATAVALAGLQLGVIAPSAQADTSPAAGTPQTVSAQALPTAQIDGVVWSQEIVGNRVFVGGNFTKARPAGVALGGPGEVNRTYLMAYNLTTGVLDSSFAPVLNGQVKDLALSPDKATLYAVGQFSTVNGLNRYRVAAFDTATGALQSFQPSVNGTVSTVAATEDRIYIGGAFTTVGGALRDGAASVLRSNATVTTFNPILGNGDPQAVVVSPDRTKVVLGGDFTTTNGSGNPGYGLAMVDSTLGTTNLPMQVNSVVRNGGGTAAILALESTADGFYGTGYTYGRVEGNLEGMFRADWNGNLVFLEDCHGDSYAVYPAAEAVYTASHAHFCGNSGGFPQPTTWSYWRGMAWSNSVGGTVAKENLGYRDLEGQPRPNILQFFPDFDIGTFTGQSQGPWEVTGNENYVVYGGEFTKVNFVGQQGLVRFAKPGVVAPRQKPELDYNSYRPTFIAMDNGQARVGWPATWDRDNERLTYQLYRNSVKIYETQASSKFWILPRLSFVDSGLVAGQSYTYSLKVTDPDGNLTWNQPTTYVYSTGAALPTYDQLVLSDNPMNLWRLNETSGTAANDIVGGETGTKGTLVTVGATGAIAGSSDTAYQFNPTNTSTTSTVIPQVLATGSNTFSAEAWFKTTSTRGGALLNFGGSRSGNSSTSAIDRVIYLTNDGRVTFGVQPNQYRTINSVAGFNNGVWHHVVGTLGQDGMKLYLDAKEVGSRTDWTVARNFTGVWRIGGDRLTGWPSNPSNQYLSATLDEVAVYSTVLSAAEINAHYVAGTTGQIPNQLPTAALTTTISDLTVNANSAGSTDPDGTITSYTWNFGDNTPILTGATAQHTYSVGGTYVVTLTVVDDRGGSATSNQQVTVIAPNQLPTAAFTKVSTDLKVDVDGTGSTDPDGAIAGYAWDYGDGSTATGSTGSHTYAGTGSFTIKLTVTDNRGGTATNSQLVNVVAPNQLPTAAFTWTAAALNVTFNGSSSSDPDGNITGYAWDFGDNTTGTGVSPVHTYAGANDYLVKLTVTDNRSGTAVRSGTITVSAHVNAKPTANFTSTVAGLKASLDGSSSTDDGTLASYAWNFGDSSNGTGVSPEHTYSTDGTYNVTLVVTDDEGLASDPVTKQITVAAPANVKPTAAFSSSSAGLVASLDGSGSSDSDGTVDAYAWTFGDNGSGTGATVDHTYAGTGSYLVKLTVTDNSGATDSVTHLVTVGAGNAIVGDNFDRTVTRWGNSDTGGNWTYANASYYSTDGSSGVVRLPGAAASGTASLTSVSARDVNVFTQVTQDTALTGTGTYNTFLVRRVGTSDYRMTLRLSGDGSVRLNMTKRINGTATSLGDVVASGTTFAPGDVLNVRFVATGNGTTTLQGKVWKQGTAEPGTAQMRRTDAAPELQVAGDFAITTFLGGTVTTVPVIVRLDNLLVTPA